MTDAFIRQILAKLPDNLEPKTIQQTTSEFRLFAYQYPLQTFGKNDNEIKRVLSLVEYVARDVQGLSIRHAALARAAYMKVADFSKFHDRIGKFRTAKEETKSSVPNLAIRLGSYTASDRVAPVAEKLMNQVKKLGRGRQRQYHLQDVQTNRKIYEAACFYIAAQQVDEDNTLTLKTIVEMSPQIKMAELGKIVAYINELLEDDKPEGPKRDEETLSKEVITKKRPLEVMQKRVESHKESQEAARTQQAFLDSLEVPKDAQSKKQSKENSDSSHLSSFEAWKNRILGDMDDDARGERVDEILKRRGFVS